MRNTINVFNKLEELTSVVDKENLLKANKDDDRLQCLLEANLNPYRLYQFNKLPFTFQDLLTFDKIWTEDVTYRCFAHLLKKLETREITGNAAKQEILDVFCRIGSKKEFEMYKKVLLKEAIGIGAKTANKAFGKNFIPVFDLMLAPNELADITKVRYPIYVQPKLDGFRCIYLPLNEQFVMVGRRGKVIANKSILEHFKSLQRVTKHVLDGELYHHGLSFDELSSFLRSEDEVIPKGLKFTIYDCIPIKDWTNKSCELTYEERLRLARELINDNIADYNKVIDIANDIAETPGDVKRLYREYLKDDYEGVMLKDPNGLYQWKRITVKNGAMLKLKPFKSIDLRVVGVYDGEGNFEGMAGGILVDNNGTTCRIGSGFTMEVRKELQKNPKVYIDKIAEIKYFEETADKNLRFPTFMRWRDDK